MGGFPLSIVSWAPVCDGPRFIPRPKRMRLYSVRAEGRQGRRDLVIIGNPGLCRRGMLCATIRDEFLRCLALHKNIRPLFQHGYSQKKANSSWNIYRFSLIGPDYFATFAIVVWTYFRQKTTLPEYGPKESTYEQSDTARDSQTVYRMSPYAIGGARSSHFWAFPGHNRDHLGGVTKKKGGCPHRTRHSGILFPFCYTEVSSISARPAGRVLRRSRAQWHRPLSRAS
jgi:hypothetical protein